jgi:DNA-binding transcriptional regulator LsrR (DeoR family)
MSNPQKGKTVNRQALSDRMRRRSRSIAGMTLVAAVAVSIAGCSQSAEDDQKVITIFGEQGGQMDLNTNSFTLELEKKFNCKITFPSTEEASDTVTVSGPEYQVPLAVDEFLVSFAVRTE